MLSCYYTTKDLSFTLIRDGFHYKFQFEAIPNAKEVVAGKPFEASYEQIYLSTPSDLGEMKLILARQGEDPEAVFKTVNPKEAFEKGDFPLNIGFKTEDELEEVLEAAKEKGSFSLAITNAMSNALGDHLIGMRALSIFYKKLLEYFPRDKITIDLFQLNPRRIECVTTQWKAVYSNVRFLPTTLSQLLKYDAIVDFGGMLLYDNFDGQPMIDFYLDGFSLDKTKVPDESKRNLWAPAVEPQETIKLLFKVLRRRANSPILLFHPVSTSPLRSIEKESYHRVLTEILDATDYFIVSAVPDDFKHERYLNVHKYSITVDEFAMIISEADCMVCTDTAAYHIADAVNTPTVAIFTSIPPEWRSKYYPLCESIMLEEENGLIYGKHKIDRTEEIGESLEIEVEDDELKKCTEYANSLWKKLQGKEIIDKLSVVIARKAESVPTPA